jgi:hypothetical protein
MLLARHRQKLIAGRLEPEAAAVSPAWHSNYRFKRLTGKDD